MHLLPVNALHVPSFFFAVFFCDATNCLEEGAKFRIFLRGFFHQQKISDIKKYPISCGPLFFQDD